jgi:hypothetical protein
MSQAASGMILQNQMQLPVRIFSFKIAALGSLKRVPGRIFKNQSVISKKQAKKQKNVITTSQCNESSNLLL